MTINPGKGTNVGMTENVGMKNEGESNVKEWKTYTLKSQYVNFTAHVEYFLSHRTRLGTEPGRGKSQIPLRLLVRSWSQTGRSACR